MAGGRNRPGTPLPAFMREALDARRRRRLCWVAGEDGRRPWPGIVVRWSRADAGWVALVAYVVELSGDGTRLVVEQLPADRLAPVE